MICTLKHERPVVPVRHVVVILIILAVVAYSSHAIERHGMEAEQIRKCLENKNPILRLSNPFTQRVARVCWTNNKYGIQITDQSEKNEITSFYDKGSKTIEQVIRYLLNAGYVE